MIDNMAWMTRLTCSRVIAELLTYDFSFCFP